jgi:hypothetical protein
MMAAANPPRSMIMKIPDNLSRALTTAIREHLGHGKGTREVTISRIGTVHVKGYANGRTDHVGWRFAGYTGDVLRDIERSKPQT